MAKNAGVLSAEDTVKPLSGAAPAPCPTVAGAGRPEALGPEQHPALLDGELDIAADRLVGDDRERLVQGQPEDDAQADDPAAHEEGERQLKSRIDEKVSSLVTHAGSVRTQYNRHRAPGNQTNF